jgi:hypothetical protein
VSFVDDLRAALRALLRAPAFFGMAIFKSYMDMRGTADIKYDDSAITKLLDRWTLSVRLVPNTWREIHPL